MAPRPVLVVQHEASCPPGRLTGWARQAGVELDVRRAHAGDPLPETLAGFGGYVLLGGTMGAYDDGLHPWLAPAKALVVDARDQGVPFFGICLGHQLATVALGGRVVTDESGPHRGVSPVGVMPGASDALVDALPAGARVVHWNDDVVAELPAGADLLARDPRGRPQLVRFAPAAWGIQGHPEADPDIVGEWGRPKPGESPEEAAANAEARAAVEATSAELESAWRPAMLSFFEQTRLGEA